MVLLGEAGEAVPVDLVPGGGGDGAVGDGAQGGGAAALLEQGAFPHHRAGAELADLGAVDPDAKHPIQQQVDVLAGLALLGEQCAFSQRADGRLGAAAHDSGRQLPLQGAFGHGHQRLAVFFSPGAGLVVFGAGPVAEAGQPGLGHQLASVVVDPVAGKRAGAG